MNNDDEKIEPKVSLSDQERKEIHDMAVRFSIASGLQLEDGEEIAQDAFVVIIDSNPPPQSTTTLQWAVGVIRTLIKAKRRKRGPVDDGAEDVDPPPDEDVLALGERALAVNREIDECIDRCCGRIGLNDLKMVTAYMDIDAKQDKKYREMMARRMEITYKALRTRISRIFNPVKECFFRCCERQPNATEIISRKNLSTRRLSSLIKERIRDAKNWPDPSTE